MLPPCLRIPTSTCPMRLVLVLLAALFVALRAEATTLTRGPYLQLLTDHSVAVVWNTDTAAACTLALRPLDGAATVHTQGSGPVCTITVDGLTPGTRYAYTPLADGVPLDGESVFRTDSPALPLHFLVLGDSGCACASELAVRDAMQKTPADFILHTGDMVYDTGAAEDFDGAIFAPYRDLMRALPLWPCLGNHDVQTNQGQPWRDAFVTPANNPANNENYYSYDAGDAHVLVLNSNGVLRPGSAQYVFADQDLATSTARWKFVVFHHTIYSSGSTHGSDLALRSSLVPLFDKHKVDIVLMGHEHNYERTKPLRNNQVVAPGQGTIYITTGGGGKDLYPLGTSSFTAHAESVHHFVRVIVDGDTLLAQMIRVDGTIGDTITLVKRGSAPAPRCGDGIVNQAAEQCDGDDRPACAGPCAADCTCAPVCGDGRLDAAGDVCDGLDDLACPDLCLSDCRCGDPSRFVSLTPVADTFVEAGAEAGWDHGRSDVLAVTLEPADVAYLKFDLSSVTRPVVGAQLTLHAISGTDGGTLYPVIDPAWLEGDRTGKDASSAGGPGLKWTQVDTNGDDLLDAQDSARFVPDFTRALRGFGTVTPGQAVTVDVTPLFQDGPGLYSIAIAS